MYLLILYLDRERRPNNFIDPLLETDNTLTVILYSIFTDKLSSRGRIDRTIFIAVN